eukprot:3778187-Rhodomonas_salina.2
MRGAEQAGAVAGDPHHQRGEPCPILIIIIIVIILLEPVARSERRGCWRGESGQSGEECRGERRGGGGRRVSAETDARRGGGAQGAPRPGGRSEC